MNQLTEGTTFEKARRWSLVAGVCAIILLAILIILESWGAIEFSEPWDWESGGGGDTTLWGKLQGSLYVIAGFSFAVILMVIFVLPRKKD